LTQHVYCSARALVTRCYTICHCNEYKRSKLGDQSKKIVLNAKTEQFTSAKISGNALKQGSKTYSSLRQISSQLRKHQAAPVLPTLLTTSIPNLI